MPEVATKNALHGNQKNLIEHSLDKLFDLEISITGVFVGVLPYIIEDDAVSLLVIKESDKKRFRFPGGGAESIDDSNQSIESMSDFSRFKNTLLSIETNGITDQSILEDLLRFARQTATREFFEETSRRINPENLEFVCWELTEDSKNKSGYHLKLFFAVKIANQFTPQKARAERVFRQEQEQKQEQETLDDYQWAPVQLLRNPDIKNEVKFYLNMGGPLTKAHHLAFIRWAYRYFKSIGALD